METTITREDDAPAGDLQTVGNGLDQFNRSRAGDYGYHPLRLLVRDEAGVVRGGLIADVYFGWTFVKILWLDDGLRGHGLGAQLMRRAEEAARELGCAGIWLDTFTFQAPDFYRELGYEEFGRLDEYPPGFSRHYFRKLLG